MICGVCGHTEFYIDRIYVEENSGEPDWCEVVCHCCGDRRDVYFCEEYEQIEWSEEDEP
jgi:hypothetical protein